MEFDGVDDYVDLVSNLDSLSNDTYSISFWMKPKKVATSIAVYGAAVVSSGERVMCGLEGSEFRCFDDYGYDVRGGTATANTWYHFTFTYNYPNQNASLYVDGSLIANDTTFNQAPSNLVLAKIGERHNSDRFNGSIDDVQIYSRALSAEEINATYNAQASQYYRNFTGLSDGSYSVKAYAQDYAGNLNETELRSVVVDGTAPNINFTSPTPDDGTSQSHDSVYINVTVEDALSANISAFIDWNNSLVGYWNFEDRNVLSNGTVYDDSSHCYDNETEILTDDGWKYFAELDKTEEVATLNQETMELEYQLPYEWQEYDYNDEMYNIILDNEQELLVSPEHKVYAGVKESPKSSIISLFENISTLDCCLNLGSLDQIGQFNFKASAKKGTSLSCMSCLASDLNSLNDSLGIILINASNLDNFSLNCSESICAYLRTSCLTSGFFNSSTANCGENKCKLIEGDLEIISLTGFGLKNETNMLVSTTKRISYQPSFLYLFHMPSLILLPISNAFASNSFSDSNFLSILSFQDSCFTLDSIDDLMNPDQFISGKYFILDLTSSGTDNVIDTILSPSLADYVKKRKNVKVFKGFGSEPDNFSLQPIKDVYSSFENGDEIWFMDAANEPVRVVGISKEEYNGKIYDVDVGNDVVLVRRLSDETRKNQRFFVSQKSSISVKTINDDSNNKNLLKNNFDNNYNSNDLIKNNGNNEEFEDGQDSNTENVSDLEYWTAGRVNRAGLGVSRTNRAGFESSNSLDLTGAVWSGNSNHGTMIGFDSNTTVDGMYGRGLEFDRVGGYVGVTRKTPIGAKTVMMWLKTSYKANYHTLTDDGGSYTSYPGNRFMIWKDTGKIKYNIGNGTGSSTDILDISGDTDIRML